MADWSLDPQEQLMQTKLRYQRLTIWILAAVILAFVTWACFADLDEVTRGQGKVIPSKQVQIIQSVDGGVVQEIFVQEGQQVEKGQPLLRIDDTRFRSDYLQKEQELKGLQASIIRLDAELRTVNIREEADWREQVQLRQESLSYPKAFLEKEGELVRRQTAEYQERIQSLANQLAILGEQVQQRSQELIELDSRIKHQQSSLDLAEKELALTRPLAEQGVVSEVELLQLSRQINDLRGELAASKTNRPRVIAARDEAIFKRREAALSFRSKVQEELRKFELQLASLREGRAGLQDRVQRTNLVAPVKGTVKTLHVNTLGAVVTAGTNVLEIVPAEDQLLVEAKISPKDIAFLRPGLPVVVRLSAYDFTIYGGLNGTLEHISADSIVDEEGNAFYLVRVKTDKPYLNRGEEELPIIPGMLTEVDIITGQKTVMEYLLKPILRARYTAMRER
ncbi:HlyD family type I secretion periplasmic adaptor subunit [Gallaecimonas sp. GXIMD4217]|uniref:HlyD family type I secretion periplasmic adaptor subunit n=1 Tax=Gallaecimonas sp. GXIMD4217 TaxID=3131927 RepID=UPI00311AF783